MHRTNSEINSELSLNESFQFDIITQIAALSAVWDFDVDWCEVPPEAAEHLLQLFKRLAKNRIERNALVSEMLLKDAYVL